MKKGSRRLFGKNLQIKGNLRSYTILFIKLDRVTILQKNSPRNSWAGVALVWYSKKVLFFKRAEGNFEGSTHDCWVLAGS